MSRNNNNRNSQMCIVTGPNQDIAIKLIKRMKGLFEHRLGITFANKEKGYIAINPAFDKLIISLRTAVAEENILDKESTSYSDIFDAYRLALKYYDSRLEEKRMTTSTSRRRKANLSS